MSNNRIKDILETSGMSTRELAKRAGVKEQTLYKIKKKDTMENITIDVFLKIAHGLGMTAEELYYGKPAERTYRDERQTALNAHFETFNDDGRNELAKIAERMSHDPSVRIVKDGSELADDTQAMGA